MDQKRTKLFLYFCPSSLKWVKLKNKLILEARAEIKIKTFLFQMKTLKFACEIYWPLIKNGSLIYYFISATIIIIHQKSCIRSEISADALENIFLCDIRSRWTTFIFDILMNHFPKNLPNFWWPVWKFD